MKLPIGILKVLDRSMEPLLYENDYVLVNYWHGELKVGDIVVLKHPSLKIKIIKKISLINGENLYVTGINKAHSNDSRSFGEIGKKSVIGKMLFKV